MKYLSSIIAIMCSLVATAQENTDSIAQAQGEPEIEAEVRLSISGYNRLLEEKDKAIEEKDKAIENYNNLLRDYNALVKKDSIQSSELKELNSKYPRLKDEYDALLKTQENADKRLYNTASNSLYLPYEAFSVEKIAIPAFEAIYSPDLKAQYNNKYLLLKSYQTDIREIVNFLSECEKELNEPFVKNANQQLAKFKTYSFYDNYINKNEGNTYLYPKIKLIEDHLKKYNGSTNKFDLGDLKSELNACLKTIDDL